MGTVCSLISCTIVEVLPATKFLFQEKPQMLFVTLSKDLGLLSYLIQNLLKHCIYGCNFSSSNLLAGSEENSTKKPPKTTPQMKKIPSKT